MTTYLRRAVTRVAILAAFICATVASSASAQQDQLFKTGIDALNDGKWNEAIAALKKAIDIDSKESDRKVGGFIRLGGAEYLPYFRLGEAYFGANQCGEAIKAFEESDGQKKARTIGRNASLIDNYYKQCQTRGYLLGPQMLKERSQETDRYMTARAAYESMERYIKEHPVARQVDPDALGNAQSLLVKANASLDSVVDTRRAQDLSAARSSIDQAHQTIDSALQAMMAVVAGTEAFTSRIKDVDGQLQQVETQLKDLETKLASPPVKFTPSDTVTGERGRAAGLLNNGRDKLRSASRAQGEADLSEASRIAVDALTAIGRARTQYDSEVAAAIDAGIADLATKGSEVFAQVDARARTIEEKLREHPEATEVSTEFTKLQTARNRAWQNFDRAIKARELGSAQKTALVAEQLAQQFDDLAARLGIARTLTVPDALKLAANALFEARYQDVLNALSREAAGSIDAQLRIHAHVIRAAALFALYEYSGASNDTLRAQAIEETQFARNLDSTFQPRSEAFSPRFISFFLATAPAAR